MSEPTSQSSLRTERGVLALPFSRPVIQITHTAAASASALGLMATTSSPSPTPPTSGQTAPSPIGGLAPFGLVIGLVLIVGVSFLYGRRNQ
ncbi:MAG: hypothetical protein WCP81_04895 [Actinomycetes bacterium]